MNKFISYVIVFVLGFLVCAWSIFHFYGSPSSFNAQSGGPVSQTGLKVVGLGKNNLVKTASAKVSEYVVNIDTVGNPVQNPGNAFDFFFNGPREVIPKGQGSGVIFTPDGYILTNNHVVKDAAKLTVTLKNGKHYNAKLIGRDPRTDLAVIKIDATGLPYATFADSNTAQVGDWVIAVGSPLGFEFTTTVGVISATGRSLDGMPAQHLIQTDASINPGNSGGALADLDGKVVGINTAIASTSGGSVGIGFAIPSNIARKTANQLKTHHKVAHAWLGISYAPLNALRESEQNRGIPIVGGKGVVVMAVVPGGPAEKAGLRKGDVIRKINGKTISADMKPESGEVTISDEVDKMKVGDQVSLEVLRADSNHTEKITLRVGEMPQELPSQTQSQPQPSPFSFP